MLLSVRIRALEPCTEHCALQHFRKTNPVVLMSRLSERIGHCAKTISLF